MAARWRAGWLIALLLLVIAVPAAPANARPDAKAKQAELARLKAHIAALRKELNAARSRYGAVRGELQHSEKRIAAAARALHDLAGRLTVQQRKLAALQQRSEQLQNSVRRQRRYLAEQVRAAYLMGRQGYLKILLNQDDPARVGRVLTDYAYLSRARSRRIAKLHDTLKTLDAVRDQVLAEQQRLQGLYQQQTQQKEKLEQGRRERRRVLLSLSSEIHGKDARLKRMLRDEKRLRTLVQELTNVLADIPSEPGNIRPFAQLRGKLHWPARWRIVARYHAPRGGSMRWQGVFIAGKGGEPVRAVAHGQVVFADWLRGYGLLIIIDHGDGYMTLYGHNQSLYKETGDWVDAGDVIATMGDSGGQSSSGLYFGVRRRGHPVNPALWCRLAAR